MFLLFTIPIGGGIPAGVVLAQKRGLSWALMEVLYFFSDVALAIVFEPLLLLFIRHSKRSPAVERFRQQLAKSTSRYGIKPGPFALIWITFGTDPMTGRSIAKAAGHGFLTGWALTIIGDMIFFTVLMASTLWLNNILGDGTWTVILITVAMLVMPALGRKLRSLFRGPQKDRVPPRAFRLPPVEEKPRRAPQSGDEILPHAGTELPPLEVREQARDFEL